MRFEISTTRYFSAAHQLRLPGGAMEPLHGHNWKVRVTVGITRLDEMGLVMDFHELERLIDAILAPMHNRHLNELTAFATANPSAENVAVHIARALSLPGNARLLSVRVWETNGNAATYRPQEVENR
jgi:6-pyruvoyltetrahydropterin/6-carboxytetrahydropterin synthase